MEWCNFMFHKCHTLISFILLTYYNLIKAIIVLYVAFIGENNYHFHLQWIYKP